MQSAWEKLTQGMCNAGLIDNTAKPAQTARQLKDSMKGAKHRSRAVFDKADALFEAKATKERRRMSDKWFNRGGTNTKGFFDQKAARAAKRGEVVA